MPAEKPRVEVVVEYGPQYDAGTRRAGAVLRRLIERAARELGYTAPAPQAAARRKRAARPPSDRASGVGT